MKTLNYIYGGEEEIKLGEKYYFGQLWDGEDGNAEEILESGAVAIYDEEAEEFVICNFEIVENNNDEMRTIVKVTSID